MGLMWHKSVRLGNKRRLNLSKSGASVSQQVGRVSVGTRRRGSIRVAKGWSWRFKL